jgi:hypothetical protein
MLIYAEFFSNQLVKYIVLNDVKTFNKVRTLGRKNVMSIHQKYLNNEYKNNSNRWIDFGLLDSN